MAAEKFLEQIGLYLEYRAKTKCTVYTVESHIVYVRELKEAAPVKVSCQLLGFDEKRIHIFQEMRHAEMDYVAATNEVMFLHVNQEGTTHAVPMPEEVQRLLAEILESHSRLERPVQTEHSIMLKKTNR